MTYYGNAPFQLKAAGGFDVRLKASLPTFPWVSGNVSFEHYKGDQIRLFSAEKAQRDPYAMRIGFEVTPIPLVLLNYDYKMGKKLGDKRLKDHRFDLSFRFRFAESFDQQLNRMKVAQWQGIAGGRTALVNRQTMSMTDAIAVERTTEELIKA